MKHVALLQSINVRVAIAVALITMLVGGCVGLELKERELVFRPIREAAGWYSGIPATVQEIYLPVGALANAQRIHAWWWPADNPGAPVVYYLHGARWNLTGHVNRMAQLRRIGFSVFAIDYRGFGKSDGDLPSEESVYEDARVGWQWLTRREPDVTKRYIYGHSLGGAVAVDLAANLSDTQAGARGLIVESSFTSLADVASAMSNDWLPVGLLLSQKFDSLEKIRQIRIPVLIVHGAADRYVPARLSESLYSRAREPKKLLLVPNGSHNNSILTGDADFRGALAELFGPIGASSVGAEETSAAMQPTNGSGQVNRSKAIGVLVGNVPDRD